MWRIWTHKMNSPLSTEFFLHELEIEPLTISLNIQDSYYLDQFIVDIL
jgi:hypothetical protein